MVGERGGFVRVGVEGGGVQGEGCAGERCVTMGE